MFRTSSAHEEGGERVFAVNTLEFVGSDSGRVRALRACEVVMSEADGRSRFDAVEGTEFELPCELVLLALGFSGPEPELAASFGTSLTPRGTILRNRHLRDRRAGRVRLRRRRPRSEPYRLGHRRRAQHGHARRPSALGFHPPSGPTAKRLSSHTAAARVCSIRVGVFEKRRRAMKIEHATPNRTRAAGSLAS